MLVYADPPTACEDIKPSPNITNYTDNWIVLIARYNCSFEAKIRAAQRAGYSGAIVHNVDSNELGNAFLDVCSFENTTGVGGIDKNAQEHGSKLLTIGTT